MRLMWSSGAVSVSLAMITSGLVSMSTPVTAAAAPTSSDVAPAEVSVDAPRAVEPRDREKVLGPNWQHSPDRVWTTSGDADGFHVLIADGAAGYAWRTIATLAEPGFDTDQWVGNACVTGSGRTVAVAYAPRTFTNRDELFGRGAFTALVDLGSGTVTKLPALSSLAYFSPGCGVAENVVFSQFNDTTGMRTRLIQVDAASHALAPPVEVAGQLTSAVPTTAGIVGADTGRIVRVAPDGTRTAVASTSVVPFQLHPDSAGGVVFLDHTGTTAVVRRVDRAGLARRPQGAVPMAPELTSGPLDQVGLANGAHGRVFITGSTRATHNVLPASVTRVETPKNAQPSLLGDMLLTSVNTARKPAADDPTATRRPVRIEAMVPRTGQHVVFAVTPAAADSAGRAPHPALTALGERTLTAGSPSNPVEAERTCSVPRNDPRNQAMQPKPRQVEWAVDQAVSGTLTVSRPANWKNLGMPAYTPQGYFPPRTLAGGGAVPAQVMLGVLAQESNLWQAPGSVVPGVTGNPLIGNYYGLDLYNGDPNDDWTIRWDQADCGYGVAQVTDGMRLAGRTRPGETAKPYDVQRAVALDFATNVAAGLQILQDKWNQTRAAGLVVNGDPSKIENWFFAVWAYNSGFHPQSEAAQNDGAWGVGWANNPVNPNYPANRSPFLEYSYGDAAHPQDWPYPEKVMGWAGHPVEILESPDHLVAGYRAAWWNGDEETGPLNRATVKPPVTQYCDASNACQPGQSITPTAPGVIGEPAGPCAHRNTAGQYDLKCWYHQANTWKPDCAYSCGNELLRFYPGYPYQDDGTAYPPNCGLNGLPNGALIIDDQPDSIPAVRPNCARPFTNQGTFTLDFGADQTGNYPSKVDFHQLGAGFGGHFWYAHTRTAELRGNSMRVTGTWTLNRTVAGWARVFVHMPDHGAHTQQAAYTVDLGTGTRTRVLLQRTQANTWVSLGSFPFNGIPRVSLSSVTYDGDDGSTPIESEDIAYDAVAFQLLPAKPRDIVVSLGDSYSSGEGASADGGGDYYRETDNNGDDENARNACHRSRYAWSRVGVLADAAGTIGQRADTFDPTLDHHLLACSGAETENLLPDHTVTQPGPRNAFGQTGKGQYGELSQLDRGFLDSDTTLVTLSIGGNDARFAAILTECLVPGINNCPQLPLLGDALPMANAEPMVITNQVRPSVVTVLREIKAKAPTARIVLMGYPRLFDALGSCVPDLDAAEAQWFNDTANLLDTELENAATDARAAGVNVTFADPRDQFAGKAVCGDPESVHGIVAPWNKTPGEPSGVLPPVSQQSFHPNIAGQQLYANTLNTRLRDLGL